MARNEFLRDVAIQFNMNLISFPSTQRADVTNDFVDRQGTVS